MQCIYQSGAKLCGHCHDNSGLKINVAKSSVVPIHCSQINLDEVLANFSGLRASFPISYLGLPITLGRLRICHLQFILNRATAKLSRWHGRMFNIGGRRELVRSILSSIPTYLLTALHAPKHFYKDLNKMRCRFFWSRMQQLHGRKCKVNWNRVSRPIHRDGLGILNLDCFGRALRLRWLWFQWKSGRQTACSGGSGRTSISALSTSGIWKLCCTSSWSVPLPRLAGGK
jgi:hypothetical protein